MHSIGNVEMYIVKGITDFIGGIPMAMLVYAGILSIL